MKEKFSGGLEHQLEVIKMKRKTYQGKLEFMMRNDASIILVAYPFIPFERNHPYYQGGSTSIKA